MAQNQMVSLSYKQVLTLDSRAYLEKGPSAAQVERVELIKEKSGVSDEEVRQALGGESSGYEVRNYKG